jgi:outer membrane protein OmpA-like peptidoglycan-associated protein
VANYISQKNINSDRINVLYFGESKPLDVSHTKDGMAKNRRVEFKIIKM